MTIYTHCPRCSAPFTDAGICPACFPHASLPVGSADILPPVMPSSVPLTEERIRELAREQILIAASDPDSDLVAHVQAIAREIAREMVARTMERLIDDAEADDRARRQ